MVNVHDGLVVRILPGPNKDMELLDDHVIIGHKIPKGFIFDGASFIDEDNNVKTSALIHDYYYRTTAHNFTKSMVDEMFYLAMIDLGVPICKAKTIHMAVCIGGESIWESVHKK